MTLSRNMAYNLNVLHLNTPCILSFTLVGSSGVTLDLVLPHSASKKQVTTSHCSRRRFRDAPIKGQHVEHNAELGCASLSHCFRKDCWHLAQLVLLDMYHCISLSNSSKSKQLKLFCGFLWSYTEHIVLPSGQMHLHSSCAQRQ